MSLPTGTFTFVFTDIQGSTKLLRALGDEYPDVLRAHDQIIAAATTGHGGEAFGSEGDAQNLVFEDAGAAVGAAAQAQRDLAAHTWPEGHPIRVRMGIHSGVAKRTGSDFVGMVLHETARIASAGHGGQVLLSAATRELVRDALPGDISLRDLGEHGLKDMGRPVRIYQLDIDGLEQDFAPLKSTSGAQTRLPTQVTSFVGRAEVEAVKDLTSKARLVTLTGPGGTGKTRLAIAAAREIAGRFEDGVFFVAVDAVVDDAFVTSEIATVLGLASGSEPPVERVITHLGDKQALLVLDNLEQVIDAATDIARIITECERVHIIATSRIPLQVYGEHEFPVPALAVPPDRMRSTAQDALEFEAVRLFAERAVAARPGFELSDGDAATVADIVARLDGLPLAIELAAARLRMLPLDALRDRLDDSLSLLTGGGRDLPTRQQTLRGAIAWSHDLLDEPDRRLFARLGVIAGSSEIAQIEAICGPADELGRDVFDGITSLTEQSLLRLVDQGAEPRFGMLATIREFSLERLEESGEADPLRRRHADAYLALAELAAPELIGADGRAWNDRLEDDHDDFRTALDWAVEADEADLALRIVTALWRFWQVRGHLYEGEDRVEHVLEMPSVREQSPGVVSKAEGAAGGIAYWRANPTAANRHYEAALRFARSSGDRALVAESLYNIGFAPAEHVELALSNLAEGRPYFEQALEEYRALGDRAGEASALWALHQASQAEGDFEGSVRLAQETLEIARELSDPFRTGWAAYTLGILYATRQRLPEAVAMLEEGLHVFAATQDIVGISMSVFAISQGSLIVGETEDGWRLVGASARMRQETGAGLSDADPAFESLPLRKSPETPEETRSYDKGFAMTDDEAIALARTLAVRVKAIVAT